MVTSKILNPGRLKKIKLYQAEPIGIEAVRSPVSALKNLHSPFVFLFFFPRLFLLFFTLSFLFQRLFFTSFFFATFCFVFYTLLFFSDFFFLRCPFLSATLFFSRLPFFLAIVTHRGLRIKRYMQNMASIEKLFKVIKISFIIIFVALPQSRAVLPRYISVLQQGYIERDNLIKSYFHLGLQYQEILAFSILSHGIVRSLHQLQRILACRGLRRGHTTSDIDDVLQAVETDLSGSGRIVGYRGMWQRLRQDHNLVIGKETVRHVLRIVDPEGVERRSKNRLRRRNYRGRGLKYIWHVDGYDKLKLFGFCIHGCINGYRRRILTLVRGGNN